MGAYGMRAAAMRCIRRRLASYRLRDTLARMCNKTWAKHCHYPQS